MCFKNYQNEGIKLGTIVICFAVLPLKNNRYLLYVPELSNFDQIKLFIPLKKV